MKIRKLMTVAAVTAALTVGVTAPVANAAELDLGSAQGSYDAADGSIAGIVNNNPDLLNTPDGFAVTGLATFWSAFSKLLGQRCTLVPEIPLAC